MKMKFALVFLAFSLGITAQSKLDSLYAVWQDQSQADSTRVGAYKDYIWEGFMFSNPDSAFIKAGALFTYAMDRDYVRAKAHGLYIQGVSFHLRGMYNEALTYYQQGLLIYEEIHDQEGIGNCLNATGLIYLYKNNYTRALYYFTQSLKIREAIADQQGVSSALNNIGYIYSNQGDYPKALDYYSRSLKIREANGDQQGIATSLNNIGEIYGDQGDY